MKKEIKNTTKKNSLTERAITGGLYMLVTAIGCLVFLIPIHWALFVIGFDSGQVSALWWGFPWIALAIGFIVNRPHIPEPVKTKEEIERDAEKSAMKYVALKGDDWV